METLGNDAWQPKRDRQVSKSLQVYSMLASSAASGAARDLSLLEGVVRKKQG